MQEEINIDNVTICSVSGAILQNKGTMTAFATHIFIPMHNYTKARTYNTKREDHSYVLTVQEY
jgi:hypothetical protein